MSKEEVNARWQEGDAAVLRDSKQRARGREHAGARGDLSSRLTRARRAGGRSRTITPPQSYLAIDLGAESGRAMLGEFDGQRLRLSEAHRFANVPVRLPDGLHWDLLRLWTDIRRAGAGRAQVEPAAGQHRRGRLGGGFWPGRRADRLLGDPFHYRDSRTDGMAELVFRKMAWEKVYDLTGHSVPAGQHALPALFAGGEPVAPSRCGRDLIDDARPVQLLAHRREGGGVYHRHHLPVLRHAPARLGRPAVGGPQPSPASLPGCRSARHGARRPAARGGRRDRRRGASGNCAGLPRHRLGRGRRARPGPELRLAQLGHVVRHRRGSPRAHHQPGQPEIQLYQRGRRGRHLPLFEKRGGPVAGAGMPPDVGGAGRGAFVRRAHRPGRRGSAVRVAG